MMVRIGSANRTRSMLMMVHLPMSEVFGLGPVEGRQILVGVASLRPFPVQGWSLWLCVEQRRLIVATWSALIADASVG